MANSKKKKVEADDEAAPITTSTKHKVPKEPKPKAVSKKNKMKVVTDEPIEPLETFQTGQALAQRQGKSEATETTTDQQPKQPTVASQGFGIKINHVKVVKDLFLKVKYDQSTTDGMVSNDLNSEAPIHDDLREALAELNIHCATLASQYNNEGKFDEASITCVGLSIRTGNVYGVKLIAQRKVNENKTINVLPPFTKLGDGSTYELAEELETIVDKVIAEAILYLGGKHKANPQTSMEFGDIPVQHTSTVFPKPEDEPYTEEAL